jgi:hypothetical protein
MTVASIVSHDGVIAVILDGKSYSINGEHPHYENIKKALRQEDVVALRRLVDIPKALTQFAGAGGKVEVKGGEILYDGTPVHSSLTNRILELMNGGFPFKPMLKFLNNLMDNPSSQSVKELYGFLQHRNLPITEDGCFLAYKGTRADEYDQYTGKVHNKVGATIEMPRNQVDDRREHTCSFGYHVGTMEYVDWYCRARVIIVKVNPRDAVSVPTDHSAQKLRVCRYEILGLYEGNLDAGPLYKSDGSEWDSENWGLDDIEVDVEDEVDYSQAPDGHYYHSKRDASGRFTNR